MLNRVRFDLRNDSFKILITEGNKKVNLHVEVFLISRNTHKKEIWDKCEDIKIVLFKVLSLLEGCLLRFHLITLKFKSRAQKLLKIWGSNPWSGSSKNCLSFFFSFPNSLYMHIFVFNHFFNILFCYLKIK